MRVAIFVAAVLAAPLGCAFPETRMVAPADYGSGSHYTISSLPQFTAGTNYVRTSSPDGSTLFVCADGGTRHGSAVPPDRTPAC